MVHVVQALDENKNAMAMVTEPLFASAANALGNMENVEKVPKELKGMVSTSDWLQLRWLVAGIWIFFSSNFTFCNTALIFLKEYMWFSESQPVIQQAI